MFSPCSHWNGLKPRKLLISKVSQSTDTFRFVRLQRLGLEWTKPALLDSVLSLGVILHGLYYTSADINIPLIRVPQLYGPPVADAGFSFIYLVAGLYCYWAGLALAPYRAFYALAMIGLLTAGIRIRDYQARSRGDIGGVKRRHHRHWSKRGMWNLSLWSSKNSIEGHDCHISELPAAGMFQINAGERDSANGRASIRRMIFLSRRSCGWHIFPQGEGSS